MNSIKTLVLEHDNILRMLDVINKASLKILSGAPVEVSDFKKIIDFIRKYADKTHHGKEEEFLFKVMTEELGQVGQSLVRHGMLVEHDIARLYVSDLDSSLDAYLENPTDELRLAILVAAGSYEKLLRRHIQKENDVIFPFGERELSKKSGEWVEKETHAFESKEENVKERIGQLETLENLEKKYS